MDSPPTPRRAHVVGVAGVTSRASSISRACARTGACPQGDAVRAEGEGLIVELADEAFIDETDLGCS